MEFNKKIRLLGYYNFPNQKMNPESERVEEAKQLAPLLERSIDSLSQNPNTDDDLKNVIKTPAVFVFKDEDGHLCAYFTKDKTAKLTGVVFTRKVIKQVALKYKAWFFPGDPIMLIEAKDKTEINAPKDSRVASRQNTTRRKRINEIHEETLRIKTRLRLENNFFIGQFSPEQTPGWYKISDIRNTDFTKIEDKERGVKDLTIYFRSPNKEYNRFAYYKFTWVLLESSPLKFGIDLREEVLPIYPKDIVTCLHDSIVRYPASAAKKITKTLDTLNKQLTQSGKEVFIYELLQNANDYPRKQRKSPIPVDVEFHITHEFLTFQHSGEYFNAKNIAAICDINDGEKSDNIEAIGYKGIGFKTVFLDNDYVYLSTGDYSFRFDKSATDIINTPWQILPVWTEKSRAPQAIKQIFSNHKDDVFRVKFALKPRDSRILTNRDRKDNYIDLFSSVFETERVILFIPNIRKVRVFIGNSTEPAIEKEKNSQNWCVSSAMTDDVPEFVRERINDVLTNQDADKSDGYEKVPEKYFNFFKTSVKFACRREGRMLKPVEDAILYCYLPAKRADWGFKFLMNTDMVPNGARDDIEDIELNHEITKIAGRQFFYWIKELIASKKYDLDSIFSLIPDFEECKKKKQYATFIKEFQKEFETLIKEEPFVPVVDKDGNETFACIDTILDDLTGITEKNVMTDAEFISLMGNEDSCLPIQELRESECFMDFMYQYCPSEMDINFDNIKKQCSSEDFQEWLKNRENNSRFIGHLLNKEELENFSSEEIFVEYEGELYKADKLYYDFDANGSTISFLKRFVPNLCESTRKHFDKNEKWKEFVDSHFLEFDAQSIVADCIADNKDAITLLESPNNSLKFFEFVAQNEVDLSEIKEKIPYVSEDGIASYDYNNYQYFYDDDSYQTSKESWLGDNVLNILSHIYFEDDVENNENETESENNDESNEENKKNKSVKSIFIDLGFADFNKSDFITKIIAEDEVFRNAVNETIKDDFDKSLAFFKYIFSCRDSFKERSLLFKNYVVSCLDIEGKEVYLCNDNLRYFNQPAFNGNRCFEENKSYKWLSDRMMYCLNPKYFDHFEETGIKAAESLFRVHFGIKTFTDKSFFSDLVLKNKKEIVASKSYKDKILSFIAYLIRDASRIFDGSVSFNDIKDLPLLCSDGKIIIARNEEVKLTEYDDNAINLLLKPWCPRVFDVLDEDYSKSLSKDILQLFKIDKFNIDEIITNLVKDKSFLGDLNDKKKNIDFWRWVKENYKFIGNFELLTSLPLLDNDEHCSECSSLYIPDAYQKDGIESLVKKYEPKAKFVSCQYIEKKTESDKNEWIKLFKKLGLKLDNKDILLNSVLPNLSSFEEDSVVAMMTKHIKDLKAVWEERKDEIVQLRVRTKSGFYKTLSETIIIDIPEETVSEPFKYIELSDEVATDILENNRELLQLVSAAFEEHRSITSKQVWAEEKISEYVNNIQSDESKRKALHADFVKELANLCAEYNFSSELLDKILYLVKGEEEIYKPGSDITLGSAYSPICDFESNGITELDYLSEDYIFEDNKDTIKSFFKKRGLHHTVLEGDLQYLTNRSFACYFWSTCFSRRISEYENWIDRGLFKDIVCIPTETSVRKASDLYHPRMVVYAAKSPGWKERVPSKSIVDKINTREIRDVFNKLPFKLTLSFEDCLYYLLNAQDKREEESSRRREIINWILEAEQIDDNLIESYRENSKALWRNGKGQKSHITNLYVIHPDAKQQRAIFSGDEHVMITNMFPITTSDFERVCEIFKIKCLKSEDFVPTPINKEDETAQMMRVLKPRILILAAIENADRYKEIYNKYNEIISKFRFLVCEKIDLSYDTIHNDVERIYNDDGHVFYVNSWLHNRTFTKFCSKIKSLLGISVYDNICEDVLDGSVSVEQSIEKYCFSLLYDKDFRSYLDNLDCSVAIVEEEETEEDTNEYYTEPLETSSQDDEINDDDDIEKEKIYDEDNDDVVSDEEDKSTNDNSNSQTIGGQKQDSRVSQSDNIFAENNDVQTAAEDINHTNNTKSSTGSYAGQSSQWSTHIGSGSHRQSEKIADGSIETKRIPDEYDYVPDFDPDQGDFMGSVDHDSNYEPLGRKPGRPFRRRMPKPSTKEERERLRSNGVPLELESLPATDEEINILGQCNITPEQIVDTNYLAQLRLYQNLCERGDEPEESMEDFVRNAEDVTTHKLKGGKWIHACSAARGVMYISPTIWNMLLDGRCIVCVYLDGMGKKFHYIETPEEFLQLVEKDDVVIKITGKEKLDVVKELYSGLLKNVKGTAYTLVRVASRTNMDAVFAHYVGAMAEADDGNDTNEY